MDAVAALYHSCYRNLSPQEKSSGVEVIHYTELVAKALGLARREDAYKRLHKAADPGGAFEELAGVAARRGLNPGRLRRSLNAHFGSG